MKKFFLLATLVFLYVNLFSQQVTKRPNIILIVADDLGYADLGCYGQQKIETPNIDKLCMEGLKFTQFYAGTTVCAPSRASLMTGLHTGHTTVRGNKGTKPEGQFPLPESSTTFATYLQEADYTTAAFGKWGLGFITTTGAPDKKGFDKFYGYNCQTLAHNYFPDHLWDNDKRVDMSGNLLYDSVYSAQLIQDQVMSFLKTEKQKPYFLFLPYTLPHADVIVPHDGMYEHYVKKFKEEAIAVTATDNDKHHFDSHPHAAYAAMVGRLDKYVGDIIKLLRSKGELENTLILFTSDNGPHKENGGDPVFFDSNGKFKGIKRDLYEGGIRVPLIAYWKGKIKPGVTDQMGAFWDFYPTFLQLADTRSDEEIDGVSLLPTLLKKGEQKQHEFYYWEFHEQSGKQAVRWQNWKGIKLNVGREVIVPLELYDLSTDPGEEHNVADEHPDIVQKIEIMILDAHKEDKSWPLLATEKIISTGKP